MNAVRSCVVCGKKSFKWGLVRLVHAGDGSIKVDAGQKLPGRGAYVCPEPKCVGNLGKRRELDRAFRRRIEPALYETLRHELETVVHASKVESLVGLALRAGKMAVGTAAAEKALHKRKVYLLILAEDVSSNTEALFREHAAKVGIPILKAGTKAMWGKLVDRKELAVLAVLDVHFAKGIREAGKA